MSELSSLLSDDSMNIDGNENEKVSRVEDVQQPTEDMELTNEDIENPEGMDIQNDEQPQEQERSKINLLFESLKEDPLPESRLGAAVEDLIVHYHGFLSSFGITYGFHLSPTLDLPLKETAEIVSKQMKDATLDVQAEFTKALAQWKIENPDESDIDEFENLEKGIERQKYLLDRFMFGLRSAFSKLALFSQPINNNVCRQLSITGAALRSIRDVQKSGVKLRTTSISAEGTSGSESWLAVDTSHIDDQLPGPDILKTSFDGILYEDLPIVYIKATKNNTLITVTDSKYNIITYTSCRLEGFKNAKKKSTIAGLTTGVAAGHRLRRRGIHNVRVAVKGLGPGRMTSVRGLADAGIKVISITDNTPLNELGPRPRKIRRV
uniref:30S ribosomal protein S11 n=1 Tax=Parastrongyloides trichosuri TaxID=131310 RepID=A0A0N4ZRJ7_PARTI